METIRIISFILNLLDFYQWLLIFYVLAGWFVRESSGLAYDIYSVVGRLCEPVFGIFRGLLYKLAPSLQNLPVDFSPIATVICIHILQDLLGFIFLR